jgi:ABC-type transport system involved in Fe-S cluster assembly fused permease/ATPase subunit
VSSRSAALLNENVVAKLFRYTSAVTRREPFIATRIVLCFIINLASKMIALLVPFAYKRGFDLLASAAPGMAPQAGRAAFIAFMLHGMAKLTSETARELRSGAFARAGQRLGRRITTTSLAHLHSLETEFHAGSRTGALTRVLDRGTRSIMTIVRSILYYVVPSLFELVLVCGILVSRFAWSFAGVVLLAFVAFVAFSIYMNNKLTALKGELNVADNEASAKILDSLLNNEVVARFNASDHEVKRLDSSLTTYEALSVRNDWLICWQNVGQAAIFALCLTVLLGMCVGRVTRGIMSIGDVLMVATLLQQLWFPLQFIGYQYRELRQSMVDLGNLFRVLDRAPNMQDAEDAEPLVVTGGEVRFENVSFSYPEETDLLPFFQRSSLAPEPRLNGAHMNGAPAAAAAIEKYSVRNLTFTVPSGKTVALVGRSGSGKSSVLRLLSRTYDASDGRILIDGQDITKSTLASLRHAVCIVTQDVALFNDTLEYNIRYGKLSATREEVIAAAKAASIHETVMRMPLQYDTIVGERGVRLSGGERQRISIARAFLRDSKILLQDEATSALDSKTEAEVTRSLNSLGANRTRVVVAHRLSTIFDADLILVMQLGQIVEQGTHKQLLQIRNGVYADMWRRQSAASSSDKDKVSEGESD